MIRNYGRASDNPGALPLINELVSRDQSVDLGIGDGRDVAAVELAGECGVHLRGLGVGREALVLGERRDGLGAQRDGAVFDLGVGDTVACERCRLVGLSRENRVELVVARHAGQERDTSLSLLMILSPSAVPS